MENALLQAIQNKVTSWRDEDYKGVKKETLNILKHIKRIGYLYKPQIEALETYIYLKEILGNKPTVEIAKSIFDNELELIKSLGISEKQALELAYTSDKQERIEKLLHARYNSLDYSNHVYALTMGAGKTILMGTMILYDFTLSFYYPKDKHFAKNALVFAPDKTIIESLKEIKTFDYTKVLPKEYQNILLNIKYHYLESTDTPLEPIGNYNIIVSNSQKIILKTRHKNNPQAGLFRDANYLKKREIENIRLQAIRQIERLMIVVDEAHHSFGTTLEGKLKKTKATINYIHKEGKTPLVASINLTGTPYIKNKMIVDVVYYFGLKQGIEKGVLKQVRFFEYGNVKSESFVEDIVNKFTNEYQNRLEGKLPKIAFYASNINDLQQNLKPTLERVLAKKGMSRNLIIEYHTEAEENKDEFLILDTEKSKKQFVLLVGKGTEGWNCRSLVACALYRKPRSSIFVLQSSTRCLRSIGDNSTVASVFLSDENYRILDRELKNNFATTIEELKNQSQDSVEHTLTVEKKKKVKVKKQLKEIVSIKSNKANTIKILWSEFDENIHFPYIAESGILLNPEQKAEYKKQLTRKLIKTINNYTFYEIVEIINRYTSLPCLTIKQILLKRDGAENKVVKNINEKPGLISFLIETILQKAFEYKEKIEIVEEELELTKQYPFKISVLKNRNALVVYKQEADTNRLGFHINPYNFDSKDEKELFASLREVLEDDEAIVDAYFTGGVTDTTHNDFYFDYYSPLNKRVSRYFPDFLIETTKRRFLAIEVKGNNQRLGYEKNKQEYRGNKSELFDEVFAKEVGFREFQKINQNFEYHIIFDAGLQQQQKALYKQINSLN